MSFVIPTLSQLGPTLRGFRRQRNLTQTEVGRLSGLQQKTVSKLETHPERCTLVSLFKYLSAVEASLSLAPIAPLRHPPSGDDW